MMSYVVDGYLSDIYGKNHYYTQSQLYVWSFIHRCNFSRNAIRNFHNNHFWDYENPHAFVESGFQQFSVDIWAGIIGDHLMGPHFLPHWLNGVMYRQFFEETLPGLLEDVPLLTRRNMWFMHDGAPTYVSFIAREYHNDNFAQQWIGREGP